jgi:hypothetical protein
LHERGMRRPGQAIAIRPIGALPPARPELPNRWAAADWGDPRVSARRP